jgi:nitrate/nitrite-specific signal transduction histidine kinase
MTGLMALWLNKIPQRLNVKATRKKMSTEETFVNGCLSELAFDISTATNIQNALDHALINIQLWVKRHLNCDVYLVQASLKEMRFKMLHSSDVTPPLGLLNQLSYQLKSVGGLPSNDHLRCKLPGLEQSCQIQSINDHNSSLPSNYWLVICSNKSLPSYTKINAEIAPLVKMLSKGIHGWYQQQAQIQQAVDSERAAHAAELHDSMAQILGYMRIKSSRLANLCLENKDPSIKDMSNDLAVQANCAYRQARELISTSRLSLDSNNLIEAIHKAVDEFEQRSGIVFELDNRLSNQVTTKDDIQALYIVREALCNIVRHSQATHARVKLYKQADGSLKIRIEDNGIGFNEENNRQDSFGLKIMQERAKKLAANLYIIPRKHSGTRVDLHIPGIQP